MPAGSTYTPIATTTLSSAAASYTFSSISGSYTDLVLVANFQMSVAPDYSPFQVGNGSIDTGANYSYTELIGNGTSALSSRSSSVAYGSSAAVNVATGNDCMFILQLQNYSNTSTYKTMLSRGSVAASQTRTSVNLWRSTAAINTIKLYNFYGGNFASGSTFTLYGIAAA